MIAAWLTENAAVVIVAVIGAAGSVLGVLAVAGIAADAIPQALRPGVRLDEAGEGHGFGLPIARELAELHGGTLTLSTAPGRGLTATVTLPAV